MLFRSTFNADGTLLAVVSTLDDSFTIRTWYIASRRDEAGTEIDDKTFQPDSIDERAPHCVRFNPTEPLSLLRQLKQDESEIIIWDHAHNFMETCAYDEKVHSALKPTFVIEGSWIVSTRTSRRLL